MCVVITSGAGFIGSNLGALTLTQGHDVVVLDDLSTGFRSNVEGLDVTFCEGSITDPGAST